MNDFGVNLKGKVAIFKKTHFYQPGADKQARSFMCVGGNGCDPKLPGRTVTGYWISDNTSDSLDSHAFESCIDDKGREIENPGFRMKYTPPITVAEPNAEIAPVTKTELQDSKPVVIDEAPKLSPEQQQALLNAVDKAQPTTETAPVPPEIKAIAPRGRKSSNDKFDPDRIIELYKGGMKVVDIAVEMGYERGQGQNRTRAVLKNAGLL